jgi:hypothetical protein
VVEVVAVALVLVMILVLILVLALTVLQQLRRQCRHVLLIRWATAGGCSHSAWQTGAVHCTSCNGGHEERWQFFL